MSEQDSGRQVGRVTVENVNHPGSGSTVDAGMYQAMRAAVLTVLPAQAPGLTQAEMLDALVPQLPVDLFPGGAKAGWWSKTTSRRRAPSPGSVPLPCAGIATGSSRDPRSRLPLARDHDLLGAKE